MCWKSVGRMSEDSMKFVRRVSWSVRGVLKKCQKSVGRVSWIVRRVSEEYR